jgi:hypothetical protein
MIHQHPHLRFTFALILACAIAAGMLPALAASVYKVTLPSDVSIGGTKLKSGDYSVTIEGKQAVFKKGKDTFQIPVDVEKADKKFSQTTLEMDQTTVRVINLGGTDSRLVFKTQ